MQSCIECFEGKYIGCKGGYTCWDCPTGRTSSPARGGTECIAETLLTSIPQIIVGSHKYGGFVEGQNNSVMCVSWKMKSEIERKDENVGRLVELPYKFSDGFLIQWSLERSFPPTNEEDKISRIRTNQTQYKVDYNNADATGPWEICIPTTYPVHMELLYIRITGMSPINPVNDEPTEGALGSASQATDIYSTAGSCGDVLYLSQHSYPPNGTGVWTIGNFNRRLDEWRCEGCPKGADCRGPKLWPELYAKFGYTRLGKEDFLDRRNAFWPCFKAKGTVSLLLLLLLLL